MSISNKNTLPWTLFVSICLLTLACTNGTVRKSHRWTHVSALDSLLEQTKAEDADQLLPLLDSLEEEGSENETRINYERAEYYFNSEQLRTAEYYFKKALADDYLQREKKHLFYNACTNLSIVLYNKGDVEGSIKAATKGYAVARNDESSIGRHYASRLLSHIGSCQLRLDRYQEASDSYHRAYDSMRQQAEADNSFANVSAWATMANNILTDYSESNSSAEAMQWIEYAETAVARLTALPDCPPERADRMKGRMMASKAIIMAKLGRKAEAEAAYNALLATDFSNTDDGLIDKLTSLQACKRWDELLALQPRLDSLDKAWGTPLNLDYVTGTLSLFFHADVNSGRTKDALAVAERIVNSLDSINTIQQRNDAAELAVIYETQEKETKIAEQNASMVRQQLIATAVALLLVVIFFVIYSLQSRRAAKKLANEHSKLLTAYDQLEETTTAKERIESELRIARDIQMSMVPNEFPQRADLDLYASMTPAREVGGDLYDYLLQDNQLYFCVGDVSGKGVPASLFMAQVIRLFRALAKQGQEPAQIITRLNDELTENNENGMFVTMFIGLVDLQSGHLHFCNAGHNPPVMGGDEQHGSFIQMESNAPIGLWPDLEYIGEEIDSIKGKPLFVYTDGLNEAENLQQQQLGDDRLLDILRDTRFESSQQVIERLQTEVELHRNGAEPNDDLTMMCLKVN